MAVPTGPGAPIRSTHVADKTLQPFIQPTFDPAEYFNSVLPNDRVPHSELSTKTQTLLSQLNGQTAQLSNTLTQLTDEIIRGGSRLAYEVEILRGETLGFSETLSETLKDDIALFRPHESSSASTEDVLTTEPTSIKQLRMLTLVRSRLDSVIKVFGEAMQWPVAPSEVTSSFISISGPEVTAEESRNRELKGKEAAKRLETDISDVLKTSASTEEGVALALQRVEELRKLCAVWKGTAEEKARERLVDGLDQIVEDESRKTRGEGRRHVGTPSSGIDYRYGDLSKGAQPESGQGFINNLKRIKGEFYLE